MLRMKYWILPALLIVTTVPTMSSADPIPITSVATSPVTWAVNGHEYAVMEADAISWDAAVEATSALGGGWHLATITSAAEQAFVSSLPLPGIEFWLGGFQNPASTVEPGANWTWITGEGFGYQNWSPGEPNDAFGVHNEHFLGMWGVFGFGPLGTWNDDNDVADAQAVTGYVIERTPTPTPVPEPGALTLTLVGLAAARVLFSGRFGDRSRTRQKA